MSVITYTICIKLIININCAILRNAGEKGFTKKTICGAIIPPILAAVFARPYAAPL